jgi:hypothetical protein
MQLSTARWPCEPNSRWQFSLMRSGMFSGASGPQAVKRTSDNIKSNILIWLRGSQSGMTCQGHNSPSFTRTRALDFKLMHYPKLVEIWRSLPALSRRAAAPNPQRSATPWRRISQPARVVAAWLVAGARIGSGHGVAVYNNTLAQFSNFWRVPPIKSGAGCQARQAPRAALRLGHQVTPPHALSGRHAALHLVAADAAFPKGSALARCKGAASGFGSPRKGGYPQKSC